ncbi:MAG: hypothetical protein ABIQ88_00630 [Chitinophagaceae bacterium]
MFLASSNQLQSGVDDVKQIKSHPLVPAYIPVYGYVCNVKSGKRVEVPEQQKWAGQNNKGIAPVAAQQIL